MLPSMEIVEHVSVEKLVGIKEAFELIDTGKKGKVNFKELHCRSKILDATC